MNINLKKKHQHKFNSKIKDEAQSERTNLVIARQNGHITDRSRYSWRKVLKKFLLHTVHR